MSNVKFSVTHILFSVLLLSLLSACSKIQIKQSKKEIQIKNENISVVVDLEKGLLSASNLVTNEEILSNCSWSVADLNSQDGFTYSMSQTNVLDSMGEGKQIRLNGKKSGSNNLLLEITLYKEHTYVVLSCGIVNNSDKEIHVKRFSPMTGIGYKGFSLDNFKSLDGESGSFATKVDTLETKSCYNNMLITFGKKGTPKRSLVYGGLSYHEFVKYVEMEKTNNNLEISMWAEDPIGKRIVAGASYVFDEDKFYIDFGINSPFEALENYGWALYAANHVKMDSITYPGLNFWYAGEKKWGGDENKNTSSGTVEALEAAVKTGFLKYSPLAVRLEPDDYASPNNQQGWWDDEHFRIYPSGKLTDPYNTLVKWGNAITERGGVPFIYCQTARRSEDYALKFPEHMLFNESFKERSQGKTEVPKGDTLWGYDFTDPGFIKHMQEVYANYRKAGIKGLKFDYPDTGWAYDGGMEDKDATTASGYRNIFKLAFDGLGPNSDIHERLPMRGDISLGVITTHRTETDTDRFFPSMARKNGLRWYKNRVVVKYVNDVINPFHAFPANADGWRTAYTMSFWTNGRFEIGKYIEKMTKEMRYDLSRVLPLYTEAKSARPVDAFTGKEYPEIFDFEVTPDWHVLTFYNCQIEKDSIKVLEKWDSVPREAHTFPPFLEKIKTSQSDGRQPRLELPTAFSELKLPGQTVPIPAALSVELSESMDDGGLGLDKTKQYHFYDFWNQHYIGKISGNSTLTQKLRAGETRVMAVHALQPNPQFISTNRHIMQGYVDMTQYPVWDSKKKQLTGTSKVIGGEPYKIIVAMNGMNPGQCSVSTGTVTVIPIVENNGLVEVIINNPVNAEVTWHLAAD